MTRPSDIEEEIARAVADVQNAPFVGAKQKRIAAAIMPLVSKAQAEAVREAANALDATTEFLDPNRPTELAYINCTRIDAQELRHRANSIEQNSEGNET